MRIVYHHYLLDQSLKENRFVENAVWKWERMGQCGAGSALKTMGKKTLMEEEIPSTRKAMEPAEWSNGSTGAMSLPDAWSLNEEKLFPHQVERQPQYRKRRGERGIQTKS